jgi:hypothetical protein
VYPVGRCELIIPDAVVGKDGELRNLHGRRAISPANGRWITQRVDEPLGEVLAGGALLAVTHAGAGYELAGLPHTIGRPRCAWRRAGHACVRTSIVCVSQQRRPFCHVMVGEVVVGGSIRAQWAERSRRRGRRCAADGIMALLLLEMGVVGVVALVDAVVGHEGLGHVDHA